jgi:hypothetical protein
MDTRNPQDSQRSRNRASGVQRVFLIAFAATAIEYVRRVMTGGIGPANRLNAAEVGILVVAGLCIIVALRPDLLSRVERFDFAGLKFDLREVKQEQIEFQRQQQQQDAVLEDVRLALRLLIGNKEQAHLINLHKGRTKEYRVEGALRDEIRRLRAMKLIRMLGDKHVSSMPEKTVFDLAKYVELTEDGSSLAARLSEQPDGKAKDASTGM